MKTALSLLGVLILSTPAPNAMQPALMRLKASDFGGVRFVKASDFAKAPACPCRCPCSDGKPCNCNRCECSNCPGIKPAPRYGYKQARQEAIDKRTSLTVWVGLSPPARRSGVHVREELGWVNPWGQVVNQPTKLEFYYEGGRIWLLEPVEERQGLIRRNRSAGCGPGG